MNILPASRGDFERILSLLKSCTAHMQSQGIFQWNDYYPTPAIIEADLQEGTLYLLREDSDMRGMIVLNEAQSPEYAQLHWSVDEGRHLVVHQLAVSPRWQRQGIAARLMEFAEDHASQHRYTSIRLDAYSGNPGALALYEHRGYHKVGELFFPRRELPFYCYEKVI
jgi:ribosomal protein S18 acetylase RimI-like enzyme